MAAALLVAAGIAWSLLPGRDKPGPIDPGTEKVAKAPEPGGVQPGGDPDPETHARTPSREKPRATGPNPVDPSIQANDATKSNGSNRGTVASRHDAPTKQQPGDNVQVQDGDGTGNGNAKGIVGESGAGRDTRKNEGVTANDQAIESEAGRDTRKTSDLATAARNEAKQNSGMAGTSKADDTSTKDSRQARSKEDAEDRRESKVEVREPAAKLRERGVKAEPSPESEVVSSAQVGKPAETGKSRSVVANQSSRKSEDSRRATNGVNAEDRREGEDVGTRQAGKPAEKRGPDLALATPDSRKNRAASSARNSEVGGETSMPDDAAKNGVGASPPPLSDLQITGREGRPQKDGSYIIPIRVWGKGPARSRYRLADEKRPDLKVPWTEPRSRSDGTIEMELESPPLPGSDPDDTYPLLLQAQLPDGTVLSRPVGVQLDVVIKVKVTDPASPKNP